jgi:hypothetical protein
MGFFSKKPNRALQAEFIKQANNAVNWFGTALQSKKTSSLTGMDDSTLDLTVKGNRDAIREGLVHLIREHGLTGCTEGEIGGRRLVPLAMQQTRSPLEDAALCSALAINSINLITRLYYEDYPKYQPLYEMVNNLAKTCCTGAAQTIGADLPPEVVETWPYFSRIFEEAKHSNTFLWPDV